MADNGHVVLMAIGAVSGAAGFMKLVRLRRILRYKGTATGTVVATKLNAWHRYDAEAEAYVTIRFRTKDRTFEFRENLRAPLWGRHTETRVNAHMGREVKVVYDSRNPNRAMAYMRDHYSSTVIYLAIAILALGAVTIYGKDVNNVSFTPIYKLVMGWFG